MDYVYLNLWDMNGDFYHLAEYDGDKVEILGKHNDEADECGSTLYDCRIVSKDGCWVYETIPSSFLSPAEPSPWFI